MVLLALLPILAGCVSTAGLSAHGACTIGDIEFDDNSSSATIPTGCTELNLARAFADGAKMAAILSALRTEASRVTALNLRSNSFRNAGTVKALASLLAADTKLVDLQMPHTALGDGGTLAIAEALANNVDSRVATLNLFNNGITCRGAEGLAELLRKSKTLVQLDLSRNLIKSTGGVALGGALAANVATALSTLRLKSNTVKDEGAAAFATALASEHTALTELDLSRNYISNDGAASLETAMDGNSKLTKLQLSKNTMDKSRLKVLERKAAANRNRDEL